MQRVAERHAIADAGRHHDALRGVVGTYARTLQLAREIVATRISLQINTLVTSETVDDLPDIHRVVREIGAERWSLFFLIATGRGTSLRQITPARSEAVLNWALDRVGEHRPVVTTTEAPHYRRNTGGVQPSGFLPLTAGYARTENPLRIYRESPLFQNLRRADRFTGRCGCC